jgi:hypothetical protein
MESGEINPVSKNPSYPVELRGIPTAACPMCGGSWFTTAVALDLETYEIASWQLQGAKCFECQSEITLACPLDHPDQSEYPNRYS